MATDNSLSSSIDMAEKIHDTTFTFDKVSSSQVLEVIQRELKEKEKIKQNATYRDSNYRFNL